MLVQRKIRAWRIGSWILAVLPWIYTSWAMIWWSSRNSSRNWQRGEKNSDLRDWEMRKHLSIADQSYKAHKIHLRVTLFLQEEWKITKVSPQLTFTIDRIHRQHRCSILPIERSLFDQRCNPNPHQNAVRLILLWWVRKIKREWFLHLISTNRLWIMVEILIASRHSWDWSYR